MLSSWYSLSCRLPALALFSALAGQTLSQASRPFTVQDEIGIAMFINPPVGGVDPIVVSPNGALIAVHCQRGVVKENRVRDEVRIYSLQALRHFANEPGHTGYPQPLWEIVKSTYKEGPIISDLRWLPGSTGVAFLQKIENGRSQIWIGELEKRSLRALTPEGQDVTSFDIVDAKHFAYAVRNVGHAAEMMKPGMSPAIAATGMSLYSPLMVSTENPDFYPMWNRNELWAVCGGKPFAVRDPSSKAALIAYSVRLPLAMAPDGNSIVTLVAVDQIPKSWETEYPPPQGREVYRLQAGRQDLDVAQGAAYVNAYALIDLRTHAVGKLTGGPDALSAGWIALARSSWSEDSHRLLLPGAFVTGRKTAAPCIAMATVPGGSVECIEELKSPADELVSGVRFAASDASRVIVDYTPSYAKPKTRTMKRVRDGVWEPAEQILSATSTGENVAVQVKESLNDPPVLVVTDRVTHNSRQVWDPNPELKDIKLGDAVVYEWKDDSGRDWIGGLYKPAGYVPGRRYPLVIQTHGFLETKFLPSGMYPTASAARALAARGFAVLQVRDCPVRRTPDEAPCQVRGYESALKRLEADGVIDADRVGIIGFSRTCFYVLQALTTSSIRFRAASITQGVNEGYLQYLLEADGAQGLYQRDAEAIIGASPHGQGLQTWLQNSPEFNLDRINTPLQIVPNRGLTTIFMWEPYAMLRMLKKPVDLLILNTNEHILTNPGVRLASQGGTVDWFRFWLQNEEDADPSKAGQYARWRELRNMNLHNNDDHGTQRGQPK